jgi:hypothetical protein
LAQADGDAGERTNGNKIIPGEKSADELAWRIINKAAIE